MTEYIQTMNEATRLTRLYAEGAMPGLFLMEELLARGFYNVEFAPVRASRDGVVYRLEEMI